MSEQLIGDALTVIISTSAILVPIGIGVLVLEYILPKAPKFEKFLFGMFGLNPDDFEEE